jgi:two-component system phosphate regulon sensor histidine kinase PhoR
LTKLFDRRVALSAFFTLGPAALLLLGLAAAGRVAAWLVAAALLAAVAIGLLAAALTAKATARQAQGLTLAARELRSGRRPASLLIEEHGPLHHAARELVSAAQSLLAELAALAEQRDEFEAILRGMTEAVVVTAASGEVMLLNDAARRMFALNSQTDYRGHNLVELCRDPAVQRFIGAAIAHSGPDVLSTEFDVNISGPRHLRASAAPLARNNDRKPWSVLVFHDLTQLKAYESLRTDFIANLTHEIRTPLTALRGYAETLLKGVDDVATQRRFLSIIGRQSDRLARLIDDLVELSDLERGFAPLRIQQVRPERLAEEAIELVRDRAQKAGIELQVRCDQGLPAVMADYDRMNQVMINLLDNALKYTPRGGEVVAEARNSMQAGQVGVELIVRDTGEGIPAEHLPRLTERFYRVDRARSRELGGTGLGLAIVKHIVQLHQGRVTITSQVHEGTTVTVWLPAVAGVAAAARQEA